MGARWMEKGQSIVEYALLLVFIAIVVIVVLGLFGTTIGDVFSNIISGL
ncbi:MAG: Flp family type IVb pilin [Chloroflexi bacterium]|nr:Flp family type IVb pilin [Chloroflexota bacterium]